MGWKTPNPISLWNTDDFLNNPPDLLDEPVLPLITRRSDLLKLYFRLLWKDSKPRLLLGLAAVILVIAAALTVDLGLLGLLLPVGMAWVAPSTRSTGDLITAAIWNEDVVNNVSFTYQGGVPLVVDNTKVNNNDNGSGEITLKTIAIPAGSIGPNGMLVANFYCSISGSSSERTLTIKLKLGGTTICTVVTVTPISGTGFGCITACIVNQSDEAIQQGFLQIANSIDADRVEGEQGTATEDTSGALNLVITIEHQSAAVGRNIIYYGGEINIYDASYDRS